MKKILFIIVLTHGLNLAVAQNLVPNGDFETSIGCLPTNGTGWPVDTAKNWFKVARFGSSDYFNECFQAVPDNFLGHQYAHSGKGYAGFYVWTSKTYLSNYREYIQVKLSDSLKANMNYHFSMYVNLAQHFCDYTTDAIGAYFSDTIVKLPDDSFNALPFTPQVSNKTGFIKDTANWVLVEGDFKAKGHEKYMIVGNFKDYNHTDTVAFKASVPPPSAIATYFYVDDISLTQTVGLDIEKQRKGFTIFPVPVKDELVIKMQDDEYAVVQIYNALGEVVFTTHTGIGNIRIDLKEQPAGIYFIIVQTKDFLEHQQFIRQ
jgi:hypothetical protein